MAQGWYQGGLRILDVRDAGKIQQFGYSTGVATEVWDAYWVPKRDAKLVSIPGQKTNIVYTADAVRGVEVYEVDLTAPAAGAVASTGPSDPTPTPTATPSSDGTLASGSTGRSLALTGAGAALPVLALVLVGTAALLYRRRAG